MKFEVRSLKGEIRVSRRLPDDGLGTCKKKRIATKRHKEERQDVRWDCVWLAGSKFSTYRVVEAPARLRRWLRRDGLRLLPKVENEDRERGWNRHQHQVLPWRSRGDSDGILCGHPAPHRDGRNLASSSAQTGPVRLFFKLRTSHFQLLSGVESMKCEVRRVKGERGQAHVILPACCSRGRRPSFQSPLATHGLRSSFQASDFFDFKLQTSNFKLFLPGVGV